MARSPKQKMLTTIPTKFDPNFIDRLNKNYALTWVIHERRAALEAHVGGAPSYVQQSIIKRVLWLELIAESLEQKFANGEQIDMGALTQAGNTLKGYYKDLGIKPTARPIRSLHEHLNGVAKAVNA